MKLRPYQLRALEELYDWFKSNKTGHPVVAMPGGSGKSVVIAQLVKDALEWDGTRVLMLVHSKELVAQNASKLRQLWEDAPLGIYSASIGKRQVDAITYAGIQTVRNRANEIGKIDICIVDECHAISHKDSGSYRHLLKELMTINPDMRVVGYSASPYRLGHGMINEGDDALFTDILEPVSIEELVVKGYLSPLTSKVPKFLLDTDGLHKRNGEYITSEMDVRFNTYENNSNVVRELIAAAQDRKHWLIFCSSVSHSNAVAQMLKAHNIKAESLTGDDSKSERERKLADFESGKIRAMCSIGILTTGYDFEALDCIAFLRSTMSPGLYLQMAVRGMRIAPDKKNCLVLDFAGVVKQHGPITAIQPPKRKGKGTGEAVTKTCPECQEVVTAATRLCPSCGFEFKFKEKDDLSLRNDDIMGFDAVDMSVRLWAWRIHTSKTSGKQMLKVTYYGELSDPPVDEYFTVLHDGFPGTKAREAIAAIAMRAGADPRKMNDLPLSVAALQRGTPPKQVSFRKNGKFYRVERRKWAN